MLRGVLSILAGLLPMVASADCTADPTRMKPTFSAQALALCNAFFQQACESANGTFVDSTDPTLGARLEQPRALAIHNSSEYYPPLARRQLLQGTVRLAFVIDTDGSVIQVTVLESSGYDLLDAAAVKMWSEARFAVPAKLDGRPTRALGYSAVPFTLR
jgi:TonB family protein